MYTLQREPLNPIRVKEGDRLGFLHDAQTSPPIAATITSNSTIIMYHTSATLIPDLGQSRQFSLLQYPIEMSISAEYTPGEYRC